MTRKVFIPDSSHDEGLAVALIKLFPHFPAFQPPFGLCVRPLAMAGKTETLLLFSYDPSFGHH